MLESIVAIVACPHLKMLAIYFLLIVLQSFLELPKWVVLIGVTSVVVEWTQMMIPMKSRLTLIYCLQKHHFLPWLLVDSSRVVVDDFQSVDRECTCWSAIVWDRAKVGLSPAVYSGCGDVWELDRMPMFAHLVVPWFVRPYPSEYHSHGVRRIEVSHLCLGLNESSMSRRMNSHYPVEKLVRVQGLLL